MRRPRPCGPIRSRSRRFPRASSQDQDQLFLAEGLTDDLTLELGRLKTLFVSSRSASTVLMTKDPVEIGKSLGVHYVVAGSVRKLGQQVRLNVSLAETERGHTCVVGSYPVSV